MKKEKIIIIGGGSYIAKQFVEKFKNTYHFIIYTREKLNSIKNENLDYFSLTHNDFKDAKIVINFAAIVHQPTLKDETKYENVNTNLPVFLAKLAKSCSCSQFIQLSTISVYGTSNLIDNDTVENPINLYGISKLNADVELLKLQSEEFAVSILRPTMVYGGGKTPGNINTLVKFVDYMFVLPFKGINNKRSFLNVLNLANVIHSIINKKISGKIIVADEETISTNELVRLIARAFEKKRVYIKLKILWFLCSIFLPEIYKKLTKDLVVVNSYSYKSLGIKEKFSINDGVTSIVVKRKL